MRACSSGEVPAASPTARIEGCTISMPSPAVPAPSRNSSAPAPASKLTGPANPLVLMALATRLDCGEIAATAKACGPLPANLVTGTV